MKVVVAMDSFKGCMSSREACSAVSSALKAAFPSCECLMVPVSDGGEGFIYCFDNCTTETIEVNGPYLGTTANATIAFIDNGNTAIIESAQACGLTLASPATLDLLRSTSHGVGEMIKYCYERGCKRVIIGLGGTATHDAGTGMLEALGVRFLDAAGCKVTACGENIGKIARIESSPLLDIISHSMDVIIASDVSNLLCGPSGAAMVYGMQKGATREMALLLDEATLRYGNIVANTLGTTHLCTPGAGAAGGLGFAFHAFFRCTFRAGADIILEANRFDDIIKDANMIITGEGRSDEQTLMGKIPFAILTRARRYGIPAVLLSGDVTCHQKFIDAGFYYASAITPIGMPLEDAVNPATAKRNMKDAVSTLVNQISL